jgi:hypothetical protein
MVIRHLIISLFLSDAIGGTGRQDLLKGRQMIILYLYRWVMQFVPSPEHEIKGVKLQHVHMRKTNES